MRLMAIILMAMLAGCGEQPGPQPDGLAADLRRCLAQPAVAAYLLDPQLADAERIEPGADLAVRILQRRETADPDRLQLRLQITGGLQVVVLPPPDERLLQSLPPAGDAAALAKAMAQVRQSRLEAAKRLPPAQRTHTVQVARQLPVLVQRAADGWTIVLPPGLEREGRTP